MFQQRADSITPKAIFALKFFSLLFYPILIVFSSLARLLAMMVGERPDRKNPFTLREEIMTMMDMSPAEGDIEPHEQDMIRRLFDFGETTAGAVMVPLIDVISIERAATCRQAVALATARAHNRLPVHADRVDKIVGVLDTLDLLGADLDQPIGPFVRPVDYVPASRSIEDLLLDLRREGQQIAVVVDEFGGAEGIVSIEDILEEVVEDMQDEYDVNEKPTQWIRKLGDKDYLVSARTELDTLKEKLGLELPQGNYASLAGFLIDRVRDVPPAGAVIEYQQMTLTIAKATPQAIQEVRLRW